jgi:N-acetylneuraminic acid mutarotase
MLVWGGSSGKHGEVIHGDGAAYDPAIRRWRVLARSPLGARESPSALWTGREWIVWGGYDSLTRFHVTATGAAYDPATDKWRRIAASPLAARSGAGAVWTGHEAIFFGGRPAVVSDTVHAFVDAAAYDPTSDRWHQLPAIPLVAGHDYDDGPVGVWAGDRLLVWVPFANSATSVARGSGFDLFSYAPSKNRWTTIAETDPPTRVYDVFWTGTRVLVAARALYNPASTGPPQFGLRGALYDPVSGRWNSIAHGPVDDGAGTAIWTGHALVRTASSFIGGPTPGNETGMNPGDAAVWDPANDTWTRLPSAPFVGEGRSVVWTGREILAWGGLFKWTDSAQPSTPTNSGMRLGP